MNYYAGFFRRAAAFAIDLMAIHFISVLVASVTIVGLSALSPAFRGRFAIEAAPVVTGALLTAYYTLFTAVTVFYFSWFTGTAGRTLGKKIMGLRVITSDGEPMTVGRGFLRWVGYIVSGSILNLGFIWVIFDRRKQGWHDKIAGTLVVKCRDYERALEQGLLEGGPVRNSLTQGELFYS